MKREFEMSQEDYDKLIQACKPVPLIALNCGPVFSQRENVNAAWIELGKKMGFAGLTAEPIPGKGTRFFMAEPMQ